MATDRIRTELAEKSWQAIQNAYFSGRRAAFGERRAQMTETPPSV